MATGDEVRFEVRDTGHGFTAEGAMHMFERLSRSRETGHDGLGLGLYIAKSIVERHGGRIWCESKPGSGTTFAFTVPRSELVRAVA